MILFCQETVQQWILQKIGKMVMLRGNLESGEALIIGGADGPTAVFITCNTQSLYIRIIGIVMGIVCIVLGIFLRTKSSKKINR